MSHFWSCRSTRFKVLKKNAHLALIQLLFFHRLEMYLEANNSPFFSRILRLENRRLTTGADQVDVIARAQVVTPRGKS